MRAPHWLAGAAFAVLTLAGLSPAPSQAAPSPASTSSRWIVRFASKADAARYVHAASSGRERHYSRVFTGTTAQLDAKGAARLRAQPGVVSVEPDLPVHAAGVEVNPPLGLDRIDQRTSRPSRSYTSTMTGRGVTVYVVDSGLNLKHADFTGRVSPGPDYTDATATQPAESLSPTDCYGHGTHVAGIAAGTRMGVAKQATVVPVKVLNCTGDGYESDTIAALEWIVGHHPAGHPAVVNLSVTTLASTNLDQAVNAVLKAGITVVTAAGNEGADACSYSPSRVAGAITVASTTLDGRPAVDTNGGTCTDLFAPGVSITSDWIGGSSATSTLSGTSMASPFVAGAAALVLQARPSWTPAQVTAELLGKATRNVIQSPPGGAPNRMLYTLGGVTPGQIEKVGSPSITGRAAVGQTLTSGTGSWPVGVTLTRAWYRVDAAGVRHAIAGATGATYRVGTADRGQRLVVRVVGNRAGYASSTAWSAPTPVVG